jgi:hypothetical protein
LTLADQVLTPSGPSHDLDVRSDEDEINALLVAMKKAKTSDS